MYKTDLKRIGVFLGALCPAHVGHMRLIMESKKTNELTIIAVCGFLGDKGKRISLPLEKRYSEMSLLFCSDPLVHVVKMDDNEMGIAGYNNQWGKWLDELKKKISHEKNVEFTPSNVTFYVGEEEYKNSLEALGYDVVLKNRKEFPISASLIRENPMMYWEYIISPFRKYFTKHILIIGTASEGKSTLARDLSLYFNGDCALEYGHDFMEYRKEEDSPPSDQNLSRGDFELFLSEQYKRNFSYTEKRVKFCDSDALTTLMYAKCYSEDERYHLSHEDYEFLKCMAEKEGYIRHFDHVFVFPPRKNSFIQDGIRDSLHASYESRMEQYQILWGLMGEYFSIEEITVVDGSYMEKWEILQEKISEMLMGERGKCSSLCPHHDGNSFENPFAL